MYVARNLKCSSYINSLLAIATYFCIKPLDTDRMTCFESIGKKNVSFVNKTTFNRFDEKKSN